MKNYFLLLLFFIGISLQGCGIFGNRHKKNLSYFERITLERTDDNVMEEFIDSLIDRMSLTAKVGQMVQVNETFFAPDANTGQATGVQAELIDTTKVASVIKKYQIGSFLSGGKRTGEEWYKIIDQLQKTNMEYSENHIPMIFGIDHVHGTNYLANGTIFPQEINIAATFDPQCSYQMGEYTAKEAAALGHNWNYAPILGLGVNKLWPRLYETFGEDTYLAATMGAAYVHGLQETKVGPYHMAATAKHFLGYPYTGTGWDRSPAQISPQGLQEFQIPTFKAAIDAGVYTVMINSAEINGTPVHASHYYLTDLLRDQLGFHGVAITDWMDIIKLNTEHFVTENEKESTYKAIMAGVDMSMPPTTIDFCRYLKELVEEGRIPMDRIDLSVRRILRLKYKLGLFDHPYPSDQYLNRIGTPEARQASQKAAAESIVLIKNDRGMLPLYRPSKLVLAGMNADLKMSLCGGWTYSWQGDDESLYPDSMETVYTAVKKEFESSRVVLASAASLRYQARDASAVIIVTGEKPYAEGWGNIDDLDLEPSEMDLLKTAIGTGKPVILVLLEGRPRTIGEAFDRCRSVIFAGLPGMFGGEAIAGILSGRINPSGKMSITYPFHSGHIIPYNYKPMEFSYLNVHNKEIQRYTIAEFGTGLSYSSFNFSDLQLSDTVLYTGDEITASVHVTNTSKREGYESVLWFLSDEVGTYTRTNRQLKFFEKKFILPGEVKDYRFVINPVRDLSYPDENGKTILEPGYYTLRVGDLKKRFYFAGNKK